MYRPAAPRQVIVARLPRRVLLLVACVLLAHAVIMATEPHASAMSSAHAMTSGMMTMPTMANMAHGESGASNQERPPLILGDCPAQRATLPLLLLIFLALRLTLEFGASWVVRSRSYQASMIPPPPPSPRRRQTLLQVFRI